jgi:hypothetical protein
VQYELTETQSVRFSEEKCSKSGQNSPKWTFMDDKYVLGMKNNPWRCFGTILNKNKEINFSSKISTDFVNEKNEKVEKFAQS